MKNYRLSLIIFLPLLSLLVSCGFSTGNDLTFSNSDEDHMGMLMEFLDQNSVPYEYIDGAIRYKRNVKDEIEKARKALATAASAQYIDTDLREHFHSILYLENIAFLPLARDGGSWTLWWAGSKDREMEILNQVAEYKITRQLEEDLDCESGPNEDSMKPSFIQNALGSSDPV